MKEYESTVVNKNLKELLSFQKFQQSCQNNRDTGTRWASLIQYRATKKINDIRANLVQLQENLTLKKKQEQLFKVPTGQTQIDLKLALIWRQLPFWKTRASSKLLDMLAAIFKKM